MNPPTDQSGELTGWYTVQFEIADCQFRIDGTHERAYKQISRERLTPEQVAYFEALWAQVGQGLAVAS